MAVNNTSGPAGMPLTREQANGAGGFYTPPSSPTITMYTPEEARANSIFQLPINASPNDVLLPSDDPTVYTYQMQDGTIYFLPAYSQDVSRETPRNVGEAAQRAYDEYIPSWEDIKNIPQEMYGVADRAVNGGATYADVLNSAGLVSLGEFIPKTVGRPNLPEARALEQAAQPDISADDFDTEFEPLNDWQPEPVPAAPANPALLPEGRDVFEQEPFDPGPPDPDWDMPDAGFLAVPDNEPLPRTRTQPIPLPTIQPDRTGRAVSPYYLDYVESVDPSPYYAEWRSPIPEVAANMTIPSQGIKGSQFLKELQDNPSIRNSEVKAVGLQIDPMRRYTREELVDITRENSYEVVAQAADNNPYQNYQRQPIQDPETAYTEILINAYGPTGPDGRSTTPFKGNSTHYQDNTLAHTRVSVRQPTEGSPYVLVEELQSDLVQQGWQKPKPPSTIYSEWLSTKYPNIHPANDPFTTKFYGPDSPLTQALENHFNNPSNSSLVKVRQTYESLFPGDGRNVDRVVNNLIEDYADFQTVKDRPQASPPPITNEKEYTRVLVQSLVGYADANDVNSIVFPPLEQIAAARFTPGTQSYKNAISPNSGFTRTYISSLNNALEELHKQFGDDIQITTRDLPYEGQTPMPTISYNNAAMDYNDLAYLRRRYGENWVDHIYPSTFEDHMTTYGPNFINATSVNDLLDMNARNNLANSTLPTQGVAVDISNLRGKYDLSRPRFKDGGLVTQTKQALGGAV